ncbi:hypothetical protein, partial [Agrobacterium tumefaciens]|uniref:hypothetical protein n=1 Tax=Agrobacterium tumefaciens TaxID=358 RepID=UPI001AEC4C9E
MARRIVADYGDGQSLPHAAAFFDGALTWEPQAKLYSTSRGRRQPPRRYAFNRQGCDYFTEFWRPFFFKDFLFCPLTLAQAP